MPLINLKTDLKDLRYGKDRKGGGNSNQPYIKSPIPDGLTSSSPDFLLRNGYLNPLSTLDDISRLTQMFFDLKSPNGVLFIAKQNSLSRSSVRTQSSTGVLNDGIYTPLSTLAQAGVVSLGGHLNKQGINPFEQTGAYSTNSSLYGVKIKPSQPTSENRLNQLYNNYINVKNNSINVLSYIGGPGSDLGIGSTNIRFASQRTGINNPSSIDNSTYFYSGSQKSINNNNIQVGGLQIDLNKKWIKSPQYRLPSFNVNSPQSGSLNSIPSGIETWTAPQITDTSIYNWIKSDGVSSRYIKLTGEQTLKNQKYWNSQTGKPLWLNNVYTQGNTFPENNSNIYSNNTFTYTQQDIIDESNNNSSSPKIQDFRYYLRASLKGEERKKATATGATPFSPNYTTKNVENRLNYTDPGQRSGKSYASYTTGVVGPNGKKVGPLDKINALPLYQSSKVTDSEHNDLVKFRIAAIDGGAPSLKTFIHFRAYLDSFSDNFSSDWAGTKYLGRGEEFFSYSGFKRNINLGWTVMAQSKEELIPMYKKLNFLASNLAPDYSKQGFMRGPLVQLTVGGYLYEQVGFITGLNYELIGDNTTWEIGINDDGGNDSTVKELPHMIKVTGFGFTPIHSFVPSKQDITFDKNGMVTGYGSQKFIALSAGNGDNYSNPELTNLFSK